MAEPTYDPATGINVPIELPPEIAALLKQPICPDISLPEPEKLDLTLPFGGSISAITDVTKQIPDSCSLNFSLLAQLGPILAPMKCILAVLGLIGPLIDIVKGLPFPPAKAIEDFAKAVPPVLECVAVVTGTAIPLFLRDIILLLIKLLSCVIDQLVSILDIMNGLSIQFDAAQGNAQLLATLECAQENADRAAAGSMQAIEPVLAILDLIAPILDSVAGQSIEIPAIGPVENYEQAEEMVATLEEFRDTLQLVADALGG